MAYIDSDAGPSMRGPTPLDGARDVPPVFDSLARVGVSGRALARLLGVSAPTISKWRHGKVRISGAKMAFLTLFLTNWLDDAESAGEVLGEAAPARNHQSRQDMRSALRRQEHWNQRLSVEAVREGSRLFRAWYEGSRGRVIQPGSVLPIEFG